MKHKRFMNEPMGEKRVHEMPGIGEALGKKLAEKGFEKAYKVHGKYLALKKDEGHFKDWLKEICGANAKQQADCYRCLKEWTDNFQ